MREIKLIRKNITANTVEHYEFDVNGFEYLVKNFNDFDIYVAFKETNDTDEMIKIPAESSQVCILNKNITTITEIGETISNQSQDVYVYAESAGEVEVQCIRF